MVTTFAIGYDCGCNEYDMHQPVVGYQDKIYGE